MNLELFFFGQVSKTIKTQNLMKSDEKSDFISSDFIRFHQILDFEDLDKKK